MPLDWPAMARNWVTSELLLTSAGRSRRNSTLKEHKTSANRKAASAAALVPSPPVNLTPYHGVFAPHHRLRARILARRSRSRSAISVAGRSRASRRPENPLIIAKILDQVEPCPNATEVLPSPLLLV